MQRFLSDSRKLTVLWLQLLGRAESFSALKTQQLTKQSSQRASCSRAHAGTSSGIPCGTWHSIGRMYVLQQWTTLFFLSFRFDSQTIPGNHFYFDYFGFNHVWKPRLFNLNKVCVDTSSISWHRCHIQKWVLPLQQVARCGSASPAELEQRGSWPGRSHTQTSLEVHSDRNNDGSLKSHY